MSQCAESVWKSEGNWGQHYQCTRTAGHGPDGKYCTQHARRFIEGNTVTWYRASRTSDFSCEIVEVQVLKETDDTLLIKSGTRARQESKATKYYHYFSTPDAAIEFYRNRAAGLRARVQRLEDSVDSLAHRYRVPAPAEEKE